jgi:MFS superfamily sulfate permease-like transporter
MWAVVTFRVPSLSAKHNASTIIKKLSYDIIPYTTLAAMIFTGTSCLIEANTNEQDWKSSFGGGVVAGAFVCGVKYRSLTAGVIGGTLLGAFATFPELANRMTEIPSDRPVTSSTPVDSSQYAMSASQGLSRKLQ